MTMKIAVIGNAGSGKSTLALSLHKSLNLPLYHLDQYYWKAGWKESDYSEFEKIHNQLCDQNQWIIDGMNTKILDYRIQSSDIVVFLDFNRYLCLTRVIRRAIIHFGRVRFSSAQGCVERIPSVKFLKFIWNFKHIQKRRIEDLILKYQNQKKFFIIKNKTELKQLLKNFNCI